MTRKKLGDAVCQCGRTYDIVGYPSSYGYEDFVTLIERVDALPSNIQIRKWFKPGTFETTNGELAARITRASGGIWTSSGRAVICDGVEYSVVLYSSGEEFWTVVKKDG
jgi:hypothetical protein